MRHVSELFDKYLKKRDDVKEALEGNYSDKKASSPINSGSHAKSDDINRKFDLDLCLPFKYNAFATLEAMADNLYDFFLNTYKDVQLIEVRKQRVSIGLTFVIDGDIIKMDVVPGRELSDDDYEKTRNLNLFVRAKGLSTATSTQTNIQKHIDLIKGKNAERQIIRLLKNWRIDHNPEVKSFFIELITIRAFDNNGSSLTGIWEQLKMSLEYIRDNVKTIRLTDPANSNNVVSDTISDFDKNNFSVQMKNILDRVEENPEALKIFFRLNEKFIPQKSSGNGPSIIPTKSFS
jgi:hypothetical protein